MMPCAHCVFTDYRVSRLTLSGIWSVRLCGLAIASFVFHIYRAPDLVGGSLSLPPSCLSLCLLCAIHTRLSTFCFPFNCLSDLTSQ